MLSGFSPSRARGNPTADAVRGFPLARQQVAARLGGGGLQRPPPVRWLSLGQGLVMRNVGRGVGPILTLGQKHQR
jgi:hypothetical protein